MKIRLYTPGDYEIIAPWFSVLATYYDGHTEDKKLIDQLVNKHEKDPNGFFTLAKEIYVCEDNAGQITGFFCLNYKRGNSVKLGPLIVAPNVQGQGIGKFMFGKIDDICKDKQMRKVYATTSQLNTRINKLFEANGYTSEALYIDQYKIGSNEIVWGKILIPDSTPEVETASCVIPTGLDNPVVVRLFNPETDRKYLEQTVGLFNTWHDDLGIDFIEATLAGYERGKIKMDFQQKTKLIVIAFSGSEFAGLGVFSPKRGGPGKLYPFYGTENAQASIIEYLHSLMKTTEVRKLYTFCSVLDVKQIAILEAFGFVNRGKLIQPYKPNTRLYTFDFFI